MPRLLKNLVINEVSAVIKGANEGAKVMIRKAEDDLPYLFEDIMLRKADDDPDDSKVSGKLRDWAEIIAPRFEDEEAAIDYLLHNPHGRRLAEHLNNLAKGNTQMTDQVDIFKVNNIDTVVAISKSIIEGNTDVYTAKAKATFDQVLIGHAQLSKRSVESILTDPATPEIRQAYALSKGYRPGATD